MSAEIQLGLILGFSMASVIWWIALHIISAKWREAVDSWERSAKQWRELANKNHEDWKRMWYERHERRH